MNYEGKLAPRMANVPPSGIRVVFDEAARLQREGRSIMNFQIGRPDFDTPVHIKEATKDALDEGFVHYTSNYGIIELREAIARKLKRDNDLEVDPELEIITTVGANEAITISIMALIGPGDEVLVPDPSWPYYAACTLLAGGTPVGLPLRGEHGFQVDPEEVRSLITPNTKLLVLNTPHNPTGSVLSLSTLQALSEIVEEHDLLVLADEVYEHIRYGDTPHVSFASLPGMKKRTLTINGFSKSYSMTGWRLGFVAAPRELILGLIRVHQYSVTSAVSFVQKGGVEALNGPQECVAEMVEEFGRRRGVVVEAIRSIPEMSLVEPQGAFYAFPNVQGLGLSDREVCSRLLHEGGVATVPGSVFGALGEGYIRFAFSVSLEEVVEGMRRTQEVCRNIAGR